MQFKILEQNITQCLEEMKAIDIIKLDVRHLTSMTDMMIIASGNSNRQVKAIANKLCDLDKLGAEIIGMEGLEDAQWVLIDFADVIVHIMHPQTREYYQLEKLWSVDRDEQHELSQSEQ